MSRLRATDIYFLTVSASGIQDGLARCLWPKVPCEVLPSRQQASSGGVTAMGMEIHCHAQSYGVWQILVLRHVGCCTALAHDKV